MTCPTCHQPMPEFNAKGQTRKFCSAACSHRTAKRDMYADEVEFLLDGGTSPDRVLASLGLKPANLARALRRANRPDLALPFDRLAKRRTAA